MSKNLNWLVILFSVAVILFLSYVVVSMNNLSKDTEKGLLAVKYLYHFSSLEELDDNMDKLREITTEEVYDGLTIDNTDRALNVYLKFKAKPVSVEIEEATNKYVIYKLRTESLSQFRTFVFFFDVDKKGKISKVRESEVLDFVANP